MFQASTNHDVITTITVNGVDVDCVDGNNTDGSISSSDDESSSLETTLPKLKIFSVPPQPQFDLDEMLTFLNERDVCINKSELEKWNDNSLKKLYYILRGDRTTSAENGHHTFDREFASFQRSHPFWNEVGGSIFNRIKSYLLGVDHANPVLFWKEYNHINELKVLRCQLSGLCYLHAPVVLQHYMCCIGRNESYGSMVNVASFIQESFKGKLLLDYLLHNQGGNSLATLRQICNEPNLNIDRLTVPDPKHGKSEHNRTCTKIMNKLRSKPALITEFIVEKKFHESPSTSFKGRVDLAQQKGMHAMVLVGVRKDPKDGHFWFLLQNWWKGRFFIEVDGEYMATSGCTVIFVMETITVIPSKMPLVSSQYAETNCDCCETLHEM